MSAASVSRSPTRWVTDTTRRKTTTIPSQPPPVPATTTGANFPIKTFLGESGSGGDAPLPSNSSKISFAPGTAFDKQGPRMTKGGGTTLNLRPVTSGERPPLFKFRPPKATLPTLQYLSVSQEDFLDPRYAEDIVKTYGIPRYFFRSKSNLLVPRTPSRPVLHIKESGDTSLLDQKSQERLEKEAEDVRPKTSDAAVPVVTLKASSRLPVVVKVQPAVNTTTDAKEGAAASTYGNEAKAGDVTTQTDDDTSSSKFPKVVPVYRPLVGDKYTQARFFPPMNPFRSLQLESEVTKYVEHKKRVGQGKYVRFAESDKPSSSLLREASMYDLNRQGPVERPLDQYLPPPDRKSFIRHRPRDLPRPIDPDPELAIMPRDRVVVDKGSIILKDMIKR